eukprot:TRINITY_DN9755_c0_g1_i2.p1 TRINITY_DN9755_c0_g1~~TRINITY_DN9755_c0_g1_i2.p1  ORF type:complete len:934 (-),score=134.60 TRINITY_DN9755_c0_g1_i2:28-2829(-)
MADSSSCKTLLRLPILLQNGDIIVRSSQALVCGDNPFLQKLFLAPEDRSHFAVVSDKYHNGMRSSVDVDQHLCFVQPSPPDNGFTWMHQPAPTTHVDTCRAFVEYWRVVHPEYFAYPAIETRLRYLTDLPWIPLENGDTCKASEVYAPTEALQEAFGKHQQYMHSVLFTAGLHLVTGAIIDANPQDIIHRIRELARTEADHLAYHNRIQPLLGYLAKQRDLPPGVAEAFRTEQLLVAKSSTEGLCRVTSQRCCLLDNDVLKSPVFRFFKPQLPQLTPDNVSPSVRNLLHDKLHIINTISLDECYQAWYLVAAEQDVAPEMAQDAMAIIYQKIAHASKDDCATWTDRWCAMPVWSSQGFKPSNCVVSVGGGEDANVLKYFQGCVIPVFWPNKTDTGTSPVLFDAICERLKIVSAFHAVKPHVAVTEEADAAFARMTNAVKRLLCAFVSTRCSEDAMLKSVVDMLITCDQKDVDSIEYRASLPLGGKWLLGHEVHPQRAYCKASNEPFGKSTWYYLRADKDWAANIAKHVCDKLRIHTQLPLILEAALLKSDAVGVLQIMSQERLTAPDCCNAPDHPGYVDQSLAPLAAFSEDSLPDFSDPATFQPVDTVRAAQAVAQQNMLARMIAASEKRDVEGLKKLSDELQAMLISHLPEPDSQIENQVDLSYNFKLLPSLKLVNAIDTAAAADDDDDNQPGTQVKKSKSTSRPGQSKFHADMVRKYGARCMVSGTPIPAVLEAPHIRPYRLGGKDVHAQQNGLLLRVDLHKLYDAKLMWFEPSVACKGQFVVKFVPAVASVKPYLDYNDHPLFDNLALDDATCDWLRRYGNRASTVAPVTTFSPTNYSPKAAVSPGRSVRDWYYDPSVQTPVSKQSVDVGVLVTTTSNQKVHAAGCGSGLGPAKNVIVMTSATHNLETIKAMVQCDYCKSNVARTLALLE